MDVQEIAALNDLRKALLSVNGAIGRLGKDKDEMVIVLPNDDWVYFNNVLSSGISSFSNYYISISDYEFTLSGIKVTRKVKEV
jgi:hypothetical protein